MIQPQYNLSGSAVGFITTLPLIAFAVVSPFVAKYSNRFGYVRSIIAAILFIMIGELLRSYTNSIGLFVGTSFLGVGIAMGNVLVPNIIKTRFPKSSGLMISLYISGMCVFAAIGAGVSIPLAKGLGLGWENSLASWFILALLTLLIWLPQLEKRKKVVETISETESSSVGGSEISIWKTSTAWWVTLFMGTQSLLFYTLVAWLPTIIVSKGMSDSFAGNMAFSFQLIAIPITLIVPVLCDRFKGQQTLVMLTCVSYLSGMIIFLLSESQIATLAAVVLMSLGMGGSISLSIAFISLRSHNAKRTSELSGMSQSAGYLLAAIGPFLMGLVYDHLHMWSIPILIMCGCIVLLAFCGYFAGRDVVV